MPVSVLCWTRNAVPGATLEHGSIGTESIIVGPLPKVFWFTSERKYVWYQCGTPSHFCLVCRLLPANILNHFSNRGFSGKCYSFSVGFLFFEKGSPLPAKIF